MKGRENIESDGFALDWVGSMCRHWEKNDPMEIRDGDSPILSWPKKP